MIPYKSISADRVRQQYADAVWTIAQLNKEIRRLKSMRSYRKPRSNPQWIYKSFLILTHGPGVFKVYDITGRHFSDFTSYAGAKAAIDLHISSIWKRPKKNPLTPAETKNVLAESGIHAMIKGKGKSAYYRGVAEGMKDVAEQYGRLKPGTKADAAQLRSHLAMLNPASITFTGLAAGRLFEFDHRDLSDCFSLMHGPWIKTGPRSYKREHGKESYKVGTPNVKVLPGRSCGNAMRQPGYAAAKNPPVEIYAKVKEIIAVKGPGHKCDAACKRAGHTYRHTFTEKAGIYGNPDGSLTIR